MKKLSKSKFNSVILVVIISTIVISVLSYSFEYAFGNADGIWADSDIKYFTYKVLVVEIAFCCVIYLLFYMGGTVSGFTSSILLTALLIGGLEKFCSWMLSNQTTPTTFHEKRVHAVERIDHNLSHTSDAILGVKALPNLDIKWLPKNEVIKFDSVFITTDSLSRRVTPEDKKNNAAEYALFLGCSYTYGDGVSDRQTLPYYFQSLEPRYKSYNYGYLAWSPLHSLAALQHNQLEKQIPQKRGIAIFTYINDHIDRVIPATRWLELTKGKFPYLEKEAMRTDGLYSDRRRIYTKLVEAAQFGGIKQYFKLVYPRKHTSEHYQLVIDIIKKTKQEYSAHFKNDDFYLVIFPGNKLDPKMKEILNASGLKYFDYSDIDTKDKMLPFDNAHSSPVLYEMVAQRLHKDINPVQR